MIFDRTQNDIDTAIRLRKEKVQNFQELTEEEIAILEKGTITINTLNRIGEKQEELKNLLNEMGYWNTQITTKKWDFSDIFNLNDFWELVYNTTNLRNAFFVYKSTPNTPAPSYYFEDINSQEKILYDIDVMINDVKSNYRECGTFQCGEE